MDDKFIIILCQYRSFQVVRTFYVTFVVVSFNRRIFSNYAGFSFTFLVLDSR
jgi:hypothetical protein